MNTYTLPLGRRVDMPEAVADLVAGFHYGTKAHVMVVAKDARDARDVLIGAGLMWGVDADNTPNMVQPEGPAYEALKEAGLTDEPGTYLMPDDRKDSVPVIEYCWDGNGTAVIRGFLRTLDVRPRNAIQYRFIPTDGDGVPLADKTTAPIGIDPAVVRYVAEGIGTRINRKLNGILADVQHMTESDWLPTSDQLLTLSTEIARLAADKATMEQLSHVLHGTEKKP